MNVNEEEQMNFSQHSTSILIKMEPEEQEGVGGADLGLSLSERVFELYQDTLDELRRGDRVRFNSTIMSMGDAQHLHHLHTFGIEKIPGHKDIEAHVHSGGRYKFK